FILSANLMILGVACTSPRFFGVSIVASLDVIFDMSYIALNLFVIAGVRVGMSNTNFVATAIPIAQAVKVVRDSYLRACRKSVSELLNKRAIETRLAAAKSEGRLDEEIIFATVEAMTKGGETSNREGLVKFIIPVATPQQVLWENYREESMEAQLEEDWPVLVTELEKLSRSHRIVRAYPNPNRHKGTFSLISARDAVMHDCWKELDVGTFAVAGRSTLHPDAPPQIGFVRAGIKLQGQLYRPLMDPATGACVGTSVVHIECVDPSGFIPTRVMNAFLADSLQEHVLYNHTKFVAGVDPASPPDWPALGESRRNSVFAPAAEARANAKTATEKAKSQAAKKVKERFSSRLAAEVGDTGRLRTLAGVQSHPSQAVIDKGWSLDVSGCASKQTVDVLGEWTPEFADIVELRTDDNAMEKLPTWVGLEQMPLLRSVSVRNNTLTTFPSNLTRGIIHLVDVNDNNIAEMPLDLVEATWSGNLSFAGNPCAVSVDWSGLGMDALPVVMTGGAFDLGDWKETLEELKLGENMFNESIVRELHDLGFRNLTKLDVSNNQLEGTSFFKQMGEGSDALLPRLVEIDVSGHASIGEDALLDIPGQLQVIKCNNCGVQAVSKNLAKHLWHKDMELKGHENVKGLNWMGTTSATGFERLPTWLRTLDHVEAIDISTSFVATFQKEAFPTSLISLDAGITGAKEGGGLVLEPGCFDGLVNFGTK
ncbi:hypothetical protein TeGR_g11856, partial [Tetraparma gracilis]